MEKEKMSKIVIEIDGKEYTLEYSRRIAINMLPALEKLQDISKVQAETQTTAEMMNLVFLALDTALIKHHGELTQNEKELLVDKIMDKYDLFNEDGLVGTLFIILSNAMSFFQEEKKKKATFKVL